MTFLGYVHNMAFTDVWTVLVRMGPSDKGLFLCSWDQNALNNLCKFLVGDPLLCVQTLLWDAPSALDLTCTVPKTRKTVLKLTANTN